jgi:hypothetical protein
MKAFKAISLLILLGTFLCLNGRTCLPCIITLIYHEFIPEHHEHGTADESRPACPFDQYQDEEKNSEHVHLCPSPKGHSRLIPVAKVAAKTLDCSFKSYEATLPPEPALPKDQLIDSMTKLRRWLNICESFSDPPLYIQHEQFLI